jgi:hypothetical protein
VSIPATLPSPGKLSIKIFRDDSGRPIFDETTRYAIDTNREDVSDLPEEGYQEVPNSPTDVRSLASS